MAEKGYTGVREYEPAGIVHRGEFFSPCSCGGFVNAYWDGEVIQHSAPLDLTIEHEAEYPDVKVLFGKEWFTGG